MFIVPKNVQNRLARIPAELRIVRYEAHENCDEIFVEILSLRFRNALIAAQGTA